MRRLILRLATLVAVSALAGCGAASPDPSPAPSRPGGSATRGSSSADPVRHGLRAHIERLLGAVEVRDTSYHPGYDRLCGAGHACVFGPEWTDDHPGRFGHNGCDTRQDVLREQMRHVEMRWGSTCRIYEGSLVDPYTGERLTWRDDGYWIQIDHVYPLAQAWYAGAWAWPKARRLRFANDVDRELLAVSGRANQDKGSGGPAAWLPRPRLSRCRYVVKYLDVARAYGLPVTPADADAIAAVARSC